MSKAEKTAEVEDVLSSIRRLIADGPRAVTEQSTPDDDTSDDGAKHVVDAKSDTDQPAGFVETLNASIAEITQDAPADDTEQPALSDAQTKAAHVTAFLETETEKAAEIIRPEESQPQKPVPFMLSPEMSANIKQFIPDPPLRSEDTELENTDTPATETDFKVPFQESHEKEAEEITMPDTVEDDETVLDAVSSTDAQEATPEQSIDEDMLREIVGEMVRAELQGDLGDRITRNVRKLVRREIHHALAARDFE